MWIWIAVAAFIGTAFGMFLMGLLNANGPSVHDAIWHLSLMFYMVDNAEMCDFRNGNVCGNIDEGAAMASRILENVGHFLLSVGDDYVVETRGRG